MLFFVLRVILGYLSLWMFCLLLLLLLWFFLYYFWVLCCAFFFDNGVFLGMCVFVLVCVFGFFVVALRGLRMMDIGLRLFSLFWVCLCFLVLVLVVFFLCELVFVWLV